MFMFWTFRFRTRIAPFCLALWLLPLTLHAADKFEKLAKKFDNQYDAEKYDAAEQTAIELRKLAEQANNRESLADALKRLARVYDVQERYAEEGKLLEQALAIVREVHGKESAEVSQALTDLGDAYQAQERYADAERTHKRALALDEKLYGNEHAYVAIDLVHLAELYQLQERYAEAEQHCKRALAIREKREQEEPLELAHVVTTLGDVYFNWGHFAESEANYRRAVEIHTKQSEPDAYQVANLTYALGDVYCELERYADAESRYKQAAEMYTKADEGKSAAVGDVLYSLAQMYDDSKRPAEAASTYRQAQAIYRETLGANSAEVADCVNDLGIVLEAQGQHQEAKRCYEQAEATYRKVFGADDPVVATTMLNMAGLLNGEAHYAEAQKDAEAALSILEKATDTDDEERARGLGILGTAQQNQGNFDEALEAYQQALELQKKVSGPEDTVVALCLSDVADVYQERGDYAEAERLSKQALEMCEKIAGSDDGEVAYHLQELGSVYQDQGRYAEAEPLYQRALKIEQQHLAADHPDVAQPMWNLANLYSDRGRYAEAEPLMRRVIAIREKTLGTEDVDVAQAVHDLAWMLGSQDRFREAEPLFQRALSIYEKLPGPHEGDIGMVLANLSTMYLNEDRCAEAEPLCRRALGIYERIYGPEHDDVARILHSLATIHRELGRWDEAKPLYERVIAILEKVGGPYYPDLAEALTDMAVMYEEQGDYDDAEPLLDRAISIHNRASTAPSTRYDSYFYRARLLWKTDRRHEAVADLREAMRYAEQQRAFASGTAHERAATFARFSEAFEKMVAWQAELGDLNEVLFAMERGRARSLLDELNRGAVDLNAGRSAAEREMLKKREAELQQRVATIRRQLELLDRNPPADGDVAARREQLQADLADARGKLYDHYRNVRSGSAVYRNLLSVDQRPPRLSQLRRQIVGDDALLLVYQVGTKTSHVLAVSPEKETLSELSVDAASAETLGIDAGPLTADRLAATLVDKRRTGVLQQLTAPETAQQATKKLAALWRVLIPQPLQQMLADSGVKRLLVVPDGRLSLLPLECLAIRADGEPRYLMDMDVSLQYAPSATVLYNLTERRTAGSSGKAPSILTVGDPAYADESETQPDQEAGVLGSGTRYAVLGGKITPLPYSGRESTWVQKAFQEKGAAVTQLIKGQATEQNVRQDVAGRSVIHLACHGLVDQSYGNFFGALALAPGDEGNGLSDDGFLTLSEICELDLHSTELTILSACDTNYGPQQRGEGVWALSRGFLVAGTRRVVASNWLVDDEAAASLISVYCGMIARAEANGKPVDYARALRDAKHWVRSQEKWKSPYYWATFVLVGPN